MDVILLQDVQKLGSKDEIVKVRSGYGRNYLIPRQFAIIASDSNKKVLAERVKQQSLKREKNKQAAVTLAEKLKSKTLKIGAKVGKSGKIFGSVTTIQIADSIKQLHGTEIERKLISIDEDMIKQTGTYKAIINLHPEVKTEVSFEVVEE